MNNVIAFRRTAPIITNFNLLTWCKKQYENYLKKQDDIRKKKLRALLEAAYNFYLDLYLTNTKNTVDICDFLYKSGETVCQFALDNAVYQLQLVIQENRIDECYRSLKESQKNKDKKNNVKLNRHANR